MLDHLSEIQFSHREQPLVQLSSPFSRTVLYSQNCRPWRWRSRTGRAMPTAYQAGVNSSLRHYFKAVAATRSVDPETVIAQMRGAQVLLLHKLH
jgi:hypothetical protein